LAKIESYYPHEGKVDYLGDFLESCIVYTLAEKFLKFLMKKSKNYI